MAEVAGLVIGGVGLASLFGECMSAFETYESGKHYGKDYEKAALKVSLLQLKLSRWGQSVQLQDDPTGSEYAVKVASNDEVDKVKKLLGDIHEDLETAEYVANKYKIKGPPAAAQHDNEEVTIEKLTARTKLLSLTRQKKSSFEQRARWALHDKTKLSRLIEDLGNNITYLIQLFPGLEAQRQALARSDALELILPSEIEEPGDSDSSTTRVLEDATAEIDPALGEAIHDYIGQKKDHRIRAVYLSNDAKMQGGDYIAPGEKMGKERSKHDISDVHMSGRSRSLLGNNYGGTNVLDDYPGEFHASIRRR